ncbi:MAG: hypothetical protein LBH60_05025 [Prevotellaceae bacterium]|jgi:hypothetical protein|nr:hypothetical protein [Prevotellaceae bacterium]
MNKVSIFTFKVLRKIYAKAFSVKPLSRPKCIPDPDIAAKLIYDSLMSDKPCMIARFGATELMTMVNYLGVHRKGRRNILKYIQGQELDWWWNNNCLRQMEQWSGFFPPTVEKIEQFCELMMDDMNEVDILGSWLSNERHFESKLKNSAFVQLLLLEPYLSKKNTWTKALENKKVLTVHPFAALIESQYNENRTKLFENSGILPDFKLQTIEAVQSLGGENNGFADWFEALDRMKREIDKRDYDICLIGCGAYGFPLAAHVKRQGKKAIHLGGALQLLFGIKGKRWEDPNYGVTQWNIPYGFYTSMMNEYWIRPGENLKPKNADKVEGSCYW